jgi:cytochrome c-type biogenesis protein
VIDVPIAYALSAGMVSAVNPCGFPMLPAYLSWFIGLDDESTDADGRVRRALVAGGAVSLGFFVVFVGLGVPVNAGASAVYRWVPWLTIVIGAALLALGAAMLTGRSLKVSLPRLDRGGRTRNVGSMFVFGVSYAITSLGCTLPVFLSVVAGTSRRESLLSGAATFVVYALGMSLVLLTLSLALALAREGMVRRLRAALRYIDRAAGGLLVLIGAYLVYYGILSRDPLSDSVPSGPATFVEDWSSRVSTWLSSGGTTLGAVLAAAVAVGLWLSITARRRSAGSG